MGILTKAWVSAVEDDGRVGVTLLDMNNERRSMILNCTESQWIDGSTRFDGGRGALIQNAFPFLSLDEREFLLTGMTPDEWDEICGEEDSAR